MSAMEQPPNRIKPLLGDGGRSRNHGAGLTATTDQQPSKPAQELEGIAVC
jgi:hypothetical protein